MRRSAVAIFILALLLAGCGTGERPMQTPPSSPGLGPSDTVPAAKWAAIRTDLAERGVTTDAIEVVSVRSVTWNDGSLGCPKPGRSYTQALVPGLQVIVSADGHHYDFRFGSTDNPKLCTP